MAKNILVLCLLALGWLPATAQKIHGLVRDSLRQQPLSAATVVLMRTDSSIVQTVRTGKTGAFIFDSIPPGNYLLSARYLGYQPFCCLPVPSPSARIIQIALHPLAQQLQEVQVQAKRPPVIEQRIDGLVYNPAGDLVAAGSNAQDLLQRVPFVTVNQDGVISLRGNSSVRVFINNKPAEFYSSNVADLLKQLSAADIERIEVITHPSARYDAEGAAGVLNIWLKKNRLRGLTGTVNANANNRDLNYNLKLNYRLTKLYGSAEIYQNWYNSYNDELAERWGQNGFRNDQFTTNSYRGRGNLFVLQGGWEPDSTQALDLLMRYGTFPVRRAQQLQATQFMEEEITRAFTRYTDREGRYSYNAFSGSYNKRFPKDREWFLLAGYSSRMNQSGYTTRQVENAKQNYQEKNDNEGMNYDLMLQTDYVHPFTPRHKLETGLKYALREVNSDYALYVFDTLRGYEQDTARSQLYHFQQSIAAAYASYEVSLDKWKFRAGVRYEYTQLSARQQHNTVAFSPYGSLVPNLLISRTISSGTTVNIGYSRRIQRPEAYHLTPAADYSDSLNITEGNPDLMPEQLNHFETGLSVIFKNNSSLNLSAYYDYSKNNISSIRVMKDDIIYNSYANIAANSKIGASLNSSLNIGKSFKLNSNINYYYIEFRAAQTITMNYLAISASATRQFPKGFEAEGGINRQSRYPLVYGYVGNWLSYYIGINKKFMENRLAVNLRFQSFMDTYFVSKGKFFGETYTENTTRKFRNPFVRIGFSYKFGKGYNTGPERATRSVEGL